MGMEKYGDYVKRAKNTLTYEPGWSLDNKTGAWRSLRPVKSDDRCTDCALCWLYCPEGCISQEGFRIDLSYCKGCGICAAECPTDAIVMERESEQA